MSSVLARALVRVLFVPMLTIAAGIVLVGYEAPGGGFAGGVVAGLAYVLVALEFGRRAVAEMLPSRAAWWMVRLGVLLALSVVFVPLAFGAPPLSHVPRPGAHAWHLGVVPIHTSLVFDAGVGLTVLGFIRLTLLREPEEA